MKTEAEPDELDWTVMLTQPTTPSKKKIEPVTFDQRECFLDFIGNNPELVTHSSTKENEQVLWHDLGEQLNKLKPERSVVKWQKFWKRWRESLSKKPEAAYTKVDYRLRKFLNRLQILDSSSLQRTHGSTIPTVTIEDIDTEVKHIEKVRTKNILDIDELEVRILDYKSVIKRLRETVLQKQRDNKMLIRRKNLLYDKRRKLLENYHQSKT